MGFTKKSWLAMVLAVVMVLGMAIPAMAELPDTTGRTASVITFSQSGAPVGTAETSPLVLYAGEAASKVDLFQGATALTDAYFTPYGSAPIALFDGADSSITPSFANGVLSITPNTAKPGVICLTVRLDHPADKKWTGAWETPDYYWEGDLYVQVMPTAKYTAGSVLLDRGIQAQSGIVITPAAFTATGAGAITISNVSVAPAGIVELIKYPPTGTPISAFELKALAVGPATVTVNLNVGTMAAKAFTFPVNVGDTTAAGGYKVGAKTTGINVKVNANAEALVYDLFVADKDGNPVTGATFVPAAGTPAVFTPDTSDANANKGGAPTFQATATKLTMVLPKTVAGGLDYYSTIKAKGTVKISGTATTTAGTTTLLDLEIPVTVTPVTASVGNAANGITFDKNVVTPVDKNYVYVTSTEVGALTGSFASSVTGLGITYDPTSPAGQVKYEFKDNGIAVADTQYKQLGSASLVINATNVTATTREGVFTTDDIIVPITVKNTTPKPVITVSPSPATFDLKTGSPATIDVTLTATTYSKYGAYLNNANVTWGAFNYAWVDTAGVQVAGGFAAVPATDTAVGTWTRPASRMANDLKVTGTVNNVPFEVIVPFKTVDTTTGKADHVTSALTSIAGFQDSDAFRFMTTVFDGTNATVTPSGYSVSYVQKDKTTPWAGTTPVKVTQVGTTAEFEVSYLGAVGEGFVKIVATSANPAGTSDPLFIPFNVKKVALTTSPASFALDMANDSTNKGTFTISAAKSIAGLANSYTDGFVTLTKNTTSSSADGKTWVYDVKGVAVQKKTTKFTAITGATINGFTADDPIFSYTVVNSTCIKADAEKIALSMEAGKLRDLTVTFTKNPAGAAGNLVITNVAVSDPTVLEKKEITANSKWQFVALKDGYGVVTVSGTINNVQMDDLVIPFTVGASETPKFTANPAGPILLSTTDASKKEATVAFSSDAGKVEDITWSASPAGIVELSNTEPWKITALAKGEAKITVNAKVAGMVCDAVTITVAVDQAVGTNDFLVDGKPATAASLMIRNSTRNNQYKLSLVGATGKVTWKISNKAYAKFVSAPVDAQASSTKTGTADQWIQVLKTGSFTVYATPEGGTAKSMKFTISTEKENDFVLGNVPTSGILTMFVGQRASAYPEIVPATAKTKGFTFKSSNSKAVYVSKSGILTAKKVTTEPINIRVRSKKTGGSTKYFKVNVIADYKTLNYNSLVLLQNVDGKPNANAQKVADILGAAKFVDGMPAANAELLTTDTTMAAFRTKVQALATKAQNTYDISVLYFSGTASTAGMVFSDGTYSFTTLAKDLSTANGNIVVFLDCKGGNRMINTKAATDSDIFTAFSKATVTGLSAAGKRNTPQFTVFTSTDKKARGLTFTPNVEGTAVTSKFTNKFVEVLTPPTTGGIAIAGTDKIVSVKELYAQLKKADKYAKVWSSSSSKLPVYANVTVPAPAPAPTNP